MSVFHMRFQQVTIICVLAGFLCGGAVDRALAGTTTGMLNAIYLPQVPSSYGDQERLFASLDGTGANSVITDLPLTEQGLPDTGKIANIVYLIHKANLKAVIVVPVRRLPGLLELHRNWEDVRYDLARDSSSRAGMLDLFRPEVVLYLSDLVKRIASYSVDGILLGQDFVYGPGDGMSDWALDKARKRLGEPVRQNKLFRRIARGPDGVHVEEYGDLFWKWAEFKRDRMLQVYDAVSAAAKSVKTSVFLGIPAPVILPVPLSREVLAQYSYDMGAFRQRNVDYYWTHIVSSDMKERQAMTYRQVMEATARISLSTATSVKDLEKRIIILDATGKNGRFLSLSELEEARDLVANSGVSGIAFSITCDTILPKTFLQKMFESRD